jgi:hypothetical protein
MYFKRDLPWLGCLAAALFLILSLAETGSADDQNWYARLLATLDLITRKIQKAWVFQCTGFAAVSLSNNRSKFITL